MRTLFTLALSNLWYRWRDWRRRQGAEYVSEGWLVRHADEEGRR